MNLRSWLRPVAAAATIVLLVVLGIQFLPRNDKGIVRVARVTGATQYFGSSGRVENGVDAGTVLGVGDTLETRSCDASVELELRDGSVMTVAGNSTLRFLKTKPDFQRVELLNGNMWISPPLVGDRESIWVETPTIAVEAQGAQFDLQTSDTTTIVRVNKGSARVTQQIDGSRVSVSQGHQVVASLRSKKALRVEIQPKPINYWACNLWKVPEVVVGRWLESDGREQARLGANPLPWPMAGREPLMRYAAALSVLGTSEHPVLLQEGSKLKVRGRTERAVRVRFGFSTQRMRGVFSGKFELDVQPKDLSPPGETWEVVLPLENFRALDARLPASPDGLELKEVYALTINEDAGLEINHVELVPPAAKD